MSKIEAKNVSDFKKEKKKESDNLRKKNDNDNN